MLRRLLVEDFEHVGSGFRVVHDAELLDDLLLEGGIFLGLCESDEVVGVFREEEGFDGGFFGLGVGVVLVGGDELRRDVMTSADAEVTDGSAA